MRALISHAYGPVEELSFAEVPVPVPGPGQVLVRAEAAALNPIDAKLVTGVMRSAIPVMHPFVPGVDVTGVVTRVGEGATRFAVGEPVLAWNGVRSGALAEYVIVDSGPASARRPDGLDPQRAAALPTGALTAAALIEAAALGPGMTVLIVGAAGGLGSYAVQLATQAGARVTATGPATQSALLRGLGADMVIDHTVAEVAPQLLNLLPDGVDVVIDLANAGPRLDRSADAARAGGRLVSPLGGPPGFARDVRAVYTGTVPVPGRLDALAAQAARGTLRVVIGATYDFADARQALIDLATQHSQGKVTITF
ncbi:NADP-dependent oxidoreductase [Nonomuraea maheshkhaliensis]|uniref:NADP-dependent oxidoreductase n=1 Tax=Nonomuraea maheshkhaliensis TaxID=419590 RepID=A0ABN2F1R8_9ACTN